jgi:hypothetical protein
MTDAGVVILGIPIPSTSKAFLAVIAMHVIVALFCVVAGSVAMLSPKSAGRHPIAGTIYYSPCLCVGDANLRNVSTGNPLALTHLPPELADAAVAQWEKALSLAQQTATSTQAEESNSCRETPTIEEAQTKSTEVAMDNVANVVELLRRQTALENQIMNAAGPAVAAEWALATTRRRLVAYPEALAAVLHTARALRRSPDMVSVRDVTTFRGSN